MRYPLIDPDADPNIPVVASDLEGTFSSGVTVFGIHKYLEENGRRRTSRSIYYRRMLGFALRRAAGRDMRAFKNDWMRDVMAAFGGRPVDEVRAMSDWVVRAVTLASQRTAVTSELKAHVAAGRRVVLVSGVANFFLEGLLDHLPGMEAIGTTPYVENGAFTGRLGTFNVGDRKVKNLRSVIGSTRALHAAYGDTFSDVAMLEMAEAPVAVHPDRRLREAAQARGWRILADEG